MKTQIFARRTLFFLFGTLAGCAVPHVNAQGKAPATIGEGTVTNPAVGPAPSYQLGGDKMVLVKNWDFGANGTIRNIADMSANFFYHDQFGTFNNGGNYGSNTVAPDAATAIGGQPVEGVNSAPTRQFTADSLVTYLTPLDGATQVSPVQHNVGNGSFMAKWKLPRGGSLLGRDIVWETRARYVTPPYFWFAIWTAGNKWKWDGHAQGAEHDLVESFGYDNGGGNTNFDGRFFHSNSVAEPSKDAWNFWDWGGTMKERGISDFDGSQYHVWTWLYRADNSFAMYVDGKLIQQGADYWWTFGNKKDDEPIDMSFLFDGGWGHNQIGSVNKTMDAALLKDKFFEWDYSRVYLSGGGLEPFKNASLPGTIRAADYDKGGANVAFHQMVAAKLTGYRADNSGATDGKSVGATSAGQWYKYSVNVPTGGTYDFSFIVKAPKSSGKFHLEDESGRDLTGTLAVPATGGKTVTVKAPKPVVLSSGDHVLKWVQESGGYNLVSLTARESPDKNATFAHFVGADTKTQGNWKGVYGAQGATIFNDNSGAAKAPTYGTVTTKGWTYSWAQETDDGRALQKANDNERIAAQIGGDSVEFDFNLTDGQMHQIALYALDWDRNGRDQTVEVRDAATDALLDKRNLNGFDEGVYYGWNVQGHVKLRVINQSKSNAALSAIFFDAAKTGAKN